MFFDLVRLRRWGGTERMVTFDVTTEDDEAAGEERLLHYMTDKAQFVQGTGNPGRYKIGGGEGGFWVYQSLVD